jgi:hypothetical protein
MTSVVPPTGSSIRSENAICLAKFLLSEVIDLYVAIRDGKVWVELIRFTTCDDVP